MSSHCHPRRCFALGLSGLGAPTAPVRNEPAVQRAQPAEAGFDWGSAAIGAAGAGGLIVLASVGAPAHRRMRTAR